jgi:citrate lyase subunit beta / citryl-CoA lyase
MFERVAWLFCPADRGERFEKAAARADVVILDLEDGVAPADRVAAREALVDRPLDPARTVVRVSPPGTEDHDLDLQALARTGYDTVMVAKTESASQLADLEGRRVVALCETPRGVLNALEIATCQHVHALMWGSEDLVAAIGGTSSRDEHGRYRGFADYARNTVLLAAAAAGKAALDAVYLDLEDHAGLRREAEDAAACGFSSKVCLHPKQVPVVREAYRPPPAEHARALAVLAAAGESTGAFRHGDQMVDEPLLRQARLVVARAERPAPVE